MLALLFAPPSQPLADVPFVHEPGRIWLKATLNGHPIDAALDTGASATAADAQAALAAGATKGPTLNGVQGAGVSSLTAWPAKNLTLAIDGLKGDFAVPYALPLAPSSSSATHRLGALIGAEVVARYVVDIDYAGGRVRFYDPAAYVPPVGFATLPITFVNNSPVVEMRLKMPDAKEQTVRAEFDTGADGVLLTGAFVAREKLLERFPKAAQGSTGGLGGRFAARALPGVMGRIAGAPIAGTATLDLSKDGATGPEATFDVLLGDAVFAHRRVVLDYGKHRMYLGKLQR